MQSRKALFGLCITGMVLAASVPASACSEIFIDADKISARTFDFPFGDGMAVITPRGTPQKSADLAWTSKFGNVTFKVKLPADRIKLPQDPGATYFLSDVDGINERGLKIGLYFLGEAEYPKADSRPAIEITSLLRYYLDNFETVAEVIADAASGAYRVVEIPADPSPLRLHMYLHDASGDSAILEYIGGQLIVHRDPRVRVLTNSIYADSLAALGRYEDFGGKERIPGSTDSLDRFVRGAYNLKHLAPASSSDEAVAYGFDTVGTIAACPGDAWPTYWTIVTDMTNRRVFIRTASDPDTSYIDLKKIDFSAGRPVLSLDMTLKDLSGDILPRFTEK